MVKKFLSRFSLRSLMVIAMMAALGIAVKSIIVPLVHIITGPLFIPGGVVAGGIYMMFLVLSVSLTGMRGAAVLCGLCQGIMVMLIGTAGSHGILSLVSYSLTGLAVDLVMLLLRHKGCCPLCCFLGGAAANLTGTLIVNSAFFSLPLIPLLLSLVIALLFGGLGGIMAYGITKQFKKLGLA